MVITDKIKKMIASPSYRLFVWQKLGLINYLPDKIYLKYIFKQNLGYDLNLKNPKTFNEKLQWLKIYNRNPTYTVMADKIQAKEYISSIIGTEHIIPTLGVWNNPDEINYNELPEQFVLKCNHNSGTGMYICKNKQTIDYSYVNGELEKGIKENFYKYGREWPYKNISPKIYAEQFIGDNLTDYRVYCFNGIPKLIYVYTSENDEIGKKPKILNCDIFDCEWNAMPFHQNSLPKGNIEKPIFLDSIIEYSKLLSKNTYFLRCDYYYTDRLWVGELTFFPGAGFSRFYSEEWDLRLGEWLELT